MTNEPMNAFRFEPDPRAASAGSPTVLLVEDEPEVVHACELRLRALGFGVDIASDGEEGVSKAARGRPDAIVMDVRMPKKDGLTALGELKRRAATRDIPVIMLSASLSAEESSLRGGARFFLRKPYRPESLVAAIRAATAQAGMDGNPTHSDCSRGAGAVYSGAPAATDDEQLEHARPPAHDDAHDPDRR